MKVAFLGDMAFYGKYSLENIADINPFDEIAKYLNQFDLVVGNLETPFYNGKKKKGFKSAHIKSIEENVKLLKKLNVKVVNLSNNHILDYGIKGLNRTLKLLKLNNIKFFGINNISCNFKFDKNAINFIGYTCPSTNNIKYNNINETGPNLLNPYIVESVLKSFNADSITVLSLHMGDEHINFPRKDHIELARKFSIKADYILYGHHPHVVQGLERFNNSILAYSLGNFCFDDVYNGSELKVKQSENNKTGAILVLEVIDNKVLNYSIKYIYQNELTINLIDDSVSQYNHFTQMNLDSYNEFRSKRMIEVKNKQNSKRNLFWYFKRLRLKSLGIIINAKKNKHLYQKYISSYLQQKNKN